MKSPTDSIPWRPVNSGCGNTSVVASSFVDYYLQKLIQFIPGVTKNSFDTLKRLSKMKPDILKNPNIWVFGSDATNMFGNIGIEDGITVIKKYIELYAGEYKGHFPSKLIIKLLRLVMSKNIFKFGNTWWIQKVGTAMGTPTATSYATIYFAYFERTDLIPRFKNNLLFYDRFIDDIFGVWINPSPNSNDFEVFKQHLNNLCNLKWKTEKLSTKTNFLDITVNLDRKQGKFKFNTFQKAMNLFLYIPAHSSHPPGLIKSISHSLLKTYWYQNSETKDYIKMAKLLFKRLTSKGFTSDKLRTTFLEACMKIENNSQLPSNTITQEETPFNKRLFFHLPYHPRDISRQRIRNEYENICESPDDLGHSFKSLPTPNGVPLQIDKLTICYSRAKNLRDILVPTKLHETATCNVQDIIDSSTNIVPSTDY